MKRSTKKLTSAKAAAKPARARTGPPKTVDEYLAGAPDEQRALLERTRRAIRAAAPDAVEGIGYGIAGFKYKSRPLAYLAYFKEHCSYFGASGTVIGGLASELKDFKQSKGTIQFTPERPLTATLVRKLVKARMAEIDGGAKGGYAARG